MKRGKILLGRRLLAVMLAAAMGVSLTACKGKEDTEGKDASPKTEAQTPAEDDDSPEAEEESAAKEETRWLLKRSEYYDKTGTMTQYNEYEYNEYGQLTLEAKGENGEETWRRTYTYDENQVCNGGTMSRKEVASFYVRTTEGVYTYDDYGNSSSRHDVETTEYEEGYRYTGGTVEYDTYYFRDASGMSTGWVQVGKNNMSGDVYDYYVTDEENEETADKEETYNEDGLLVKLVSGDSVEEYEYDDHGNRTKKTITRHANSPEEKYSVYYTYSYEEQLCKNVPPAEEPETEEKEVIAKAVTKDSQGNTLYYYTYAYNQRGEVTLARGFGQGGSFATEYTMYDEQNRVTQVRSDSMVVDKIYDESGRCIREEFREYISDEEPMIYADCEYDENGNLLRSVKHAVKSSYSDAEGSYQTYEYENDLVKKCSYYSSDGTLESYDEYAYDEEGKIVTITIYNGDGTVESITTPVYYSISVLL